jgi:hypothetical protein
MAKRKKLTAVEERERFIAAAKELGCADELPEDFEATVRKLAAMPPMTNEQVKKKAKRRKR